MSTAAERDCESDRCAGHPLERDRSDGYRRKLFWAWSCFTANMTGNVVLLGFATALRGTRMTRIGEPCRFSIKEGQEIVLPEPAQEPSQVTLHYIALMLGLDESVRLPRIYDVLDGNIAIRQRPIDLAVVIDIECADLQ